MTQIDQQQEFESQEPILEADDNKQRPLTDHLPSPRATGDLRSSHPNIRYLP